MQVPGYLCGLRVIPSGAKHMQPTAFLIPAVALMTIAPTAAAQRLMPSTTGLSVAATASVARPSAESQGVTTSVVRFAPRAELSYGATARVSLVGAVARRGGVLEGQDYNVRSVDMGLRYLGYVGRAMRPFAEGGLAVRKFSLDAQAGEINATNVGPWAALGYMWFPGGSFALEAAGTFGRVTFQNWRVAGNAAELAPLVHQEYGVRAGARWFFRAR